LAALAAAAGAYRGWPHSRGARPDPQSVALGGESACRL